ncbi:stromal cell-derived factor 2 [Strongylocentrotus purpuratus]|uniref:MIR domain-containing protein n=1 Tax=Strongylocentrotus purpuratus TaxID=7668 RepID=A0A7M7TGJ5_STRPU|nr:stromal cell-derived factor 2 [Strongylocentrotus purpuratus]|eukprot:XP_784191.1 PREDICTED: stromal cell-derived factor 2 [Strongylocentrotus purpuratus]
MAPSLTDILCSVLTVFCIFSTENSRSWTEAVQMDYEYVTCGSTVKLINQKYNVRLHSHDIHYGSGSGQQSVTAVDSTTDKNSYWQIKGKLDKNCIRGAPVKCGSTIRLQHVATKRNLHSHNFQSPLSSNQEVSCFGEDGHGDEGDNWAVICSTTNWKRNEPVRFKHVATENYLSMSGQTYGRPIHGQREVCGLSSLSTANQWRAVEGIFVKPSEGSTVS